MQQTRSLSQTDPLKAPCREACNTPFIAVLSERHAGIEQTQMTDRRLGGIVCLFGTLGTRLNRLPPDGEWVLPATRRGAMRLVGDRMLAL